MQGRGIATRAALLDAAFECLVELGYSATTTTEVAVRAGVSRGAQLHHFPTKAQLLSAAVERLFERRSAEFRKAFANLDPGVDRLDGAIDILWSMFQGPTFTAWAELWMAARTDPDLATAMVGIDRRFGEQSDAIFAELFPATPDTDPRYSSLALSFAYALMDGVALQRLVPYERPTSSDELIDALKLIAHLTNPPTLIEETDP